MQRRLALTDLGSTLYPTPCPQVSPANQHHISSRTLSALSMMASEDLRNVVMEQYLPILAAASEANPESSYWFMIGAPDFEEECQARSTSTGLTTGKRFRREKRRLLRFIEQGQAVIESMGDVATCQDPQAWDGYLIRSYAEV